MIDNYDWIFTASKNIANIRPHAFFLEKAQHGRFLHSYKLKIVKTEYFRNLTINKLIEITKEIKEKKTKIKKFSSDILEDDYSYFQLNVKDYSSVLETINQIFQSEDANSIDSLTIMKRIKFSAMLFKLEDGKSIIAIDFVTIYDKKALEKHGFIGTYDENGIEELKKDAAIIFNITFPCIYFKESNKLLILDKIKTESIFNFSEIYEKKAIHQFEELKNNNLIEYDEGVLQKQIHNITMSRRIHNMIDDGLFKTDIDIYKNYDKFLKKHPEFDDEYTKLKLKDNKVIIKNTADFKSFVFMTGFNLLETVLEDDKEYFISFKKRKIILKKEFES